MPRNRTADYDEFDADNRGREESRDKDGNRPEREDVVKPEVDGEHEEERGEAI